MFNKIAEWILDKVYKFHKNREILYYDEAYRALIYGEDEKERRYFKKFVYHSKRCEQLDKLFYAMEGS